MTITEYTSGLRIPPEIAADDLQVELFWAREEVKAARLLFRKILAEGKRCKYNRAGRLLPAITAETLRVKAVYRRAQSRLRAARRAAGAFKKENGAWG